jgi:DNA (cytosine-5)-methyltransferase 1
MKFIELFAGIGGFRLGLEKAGHQCVWANEFLEKPRRIYEHNFKDSPDGRDIRDVQPDEIPDCDLLVGGFPCATFSVAGRRTGFGTEDTRGTLFFEICRLLRSKRIPYVFLENVKGLLNHDGGRTFGVIIASLDELGYDIQWECVNSKNFGVPQNRERVFIIGSLRGQPRPEVFPLGECFAEDAGQVSKSKSDNSSGRVKDGSPIQSVLGNVPFVTGKVMETRNVFPTLDGHYWKGIQNNQGRGAVMQVRPVLTPHREEKRQNGRRIKEHNEPVFTLTAQDRHGLMVGTSLRKLTPLECERLQSLPDNWTKWYADGSLVPDAQRYERCGRAVTVNVIYEIAKRLPI